MTCNHIQEQDDVWAPVHFVFRGTEQRLIEMVDRCINGLPGRRDIQLPLPTNPERALHVMQTAAHIEEYYPDTEWGKSAGVSHVLYVRMVWLGSKRLTFVEPETRKGLVSITYSYFAASVPAPAPVFISGELAASFGAAGWDGPIIKVIRSASDHLDCTIEAVPLLAFARDAVLAEVANWDKQVESAVTAQDTLDPDQNIFLCDIEAIRELYSLLPHEVPYRGQTWIVGPIKLVSQHCWTIAVFELAQNSRKRLLGEIQLVATLAGLKVGLDPAGKKSTVACQAATQLLTELRYFLGIDREEHATAVPDIMVGLYDSPVVEPQIREPYLNGRQVGEMCAVLEASFDEWELRKLLRVHLDENFDAVAGGTTIREKIFALVLWAQRTHRVDQLLSGAVQENPSNLRLLEYVRSLRHNDHG